MKFFLATIALALFVHKANCQVYYNDIVVLKQTNHQYIALKNSHIKHVSAQSSGNDADTAKGVSLEQDISRDASQITTTSDLSSAGHSVSTNYYQDGHLVKTVDDISSDSAKDVLSTIDYTYDTHGNLLTNNTVTVDTFMSSRSEELHQWFYVDNSPSYMLRVKDQTDTTVVQFVKDAQGNIAEEHWKKKGKGIEDYFYYYNNNHQLTDIVQFNLRAKKMLPDFLFDYDDAGNVSKFTQIQQNTSDYFTWYYEYNDSGLKVKEFCYDKQKQLVGTIDYTYK